MSKHTFLAKGYVPCSLDNVLMGFWKKGQSANIGWVDNIRSSTPKHKLDMYVQSDTEHTEVATND